MIDNSELYLVRAGALPEVILKAVEAKEYLTDGRAPSAQAAARMAGISRTAFYKYKDLASHYSPGMESVATVQVRLRDTAGALSKYVAVFFAAEANILTVNQSIPANNIALVTVSFRSADMNCTFDELILRIKDLSEVMSVDYTSIN